LSRRFMFSYLFSWRLFYSRAGDSCLVTCSPGAYSTVEQEINV